MSLYRDPRRLAIALLASAVAVAVVTAAIELFKPYVPVLSLGVLYVFAVLPIAVVYGLPLALVVSVASMLAFNWFHLPPVHTFTLADSENWFALAVYFATAVVVSELAARARRRAAAAEQREQESALLAELATELLRGRELDEELDQIASPGGRRPRRRVRRDRARAGAPAAAGACAAPARGRRPLGRHAVHAAGRRRARRRAGTASCPRSPRCSRSRSTATGSSGRRSRPRPCGAAIS